MYELRKRNRLRHKEEIRQRHREKRVQVMKLFGGQCYVCGVDKGTQLQFHHKIYDSNLNNQYSNIENEALLHPERFILLCHRCHNIITQFNNHPEIRDKIISLTQPIKVVIS